MKLKKKFCKGCNDFAYLFARGLCQFHYNIDAQKRAIEKARLKQIKYPKQKPRKTTGEKVLFLEIWEEREHICVDCKCHLGNEPRVHFFSHEKPKGKYPELRLVKDNISLRCMDCHYKKDFC